MGSFSSTLFRQHWLCRGRNVIIGVDGVMDPDGDVVMADGADGGQAQQEEEDTEAQAAEAAVAAATDQR